ncbi:MAG: hypothetical protein L3K23_06535 [Thermoplasmata archaeon]|nr:hypothetical protein [Thermoplasmata archaeon]
MTRPRSDFIRQWETRAAGSRTVATPRSRATQRAALWVALVATSGLLLLSGLTLGAALPSENAAAGQRGPSTSGGCVPPGVLSPDSLLIPTTGPATTLAPGSSVTARYEAQLVTAPSGQRAALSVPSVTASFPTASGGRILVNLHPTWIHLKGSHWSTPDSATTQISTTVALAGGNSTLSSAWLAVQANTSYGSYQVQFRWQWSTLTVSGATTTSPWSGSISTSTVKAQPTRFYPAPYVGVLSTTPLTGAAPGSTFTANLSGNVSSTYFRILTESTTGHELDSVCLATGPGLTSYNASIPLDYSNGTALPAGSYIVHIHNAGAAIVVFKQVKVS